MPAEPICKEDGHHGPQGPVPETVDEGIEIEALGCGRRQQEDHPRRHDDHTQNSRIFDILHPVTQPAEKELAAETAKAEYPQGGSGNEILDIIIQCVCHLMDEDCHKGHDGQGEAGYEDPEARISKNDFRGKMRRVPFGMIGLQRLRALYFPVREEPITLRIHASHKQLGN